MKYIIIFLLAVIKFSFSIAQTSKIKKEKFEMPKGNLNCVYKPVYSAAKRKTFYPFNIADTIKLVSFRYHRGNLPIDSCKLFADSLIEARSLTSLEIDRLTDILYNNFYKEKPNYGSMAMCFYPRNAILFFNKNGKLKESILICFHCNRHEESSNNVIFGSNCDQKMEKLRQFFFANKIKFGTDKSVDLYLGEEFDEGIVYPPSK